MHVPAYFYIFFWSLPCDQWKFHWEQRGWYGRTLADALVKQPFQPQGRLWMCRITFNIWRWRTSWRVCVWKWCSIHNTNSVIWTSSLWISVAYPLKSLPAALAPRSLIHVPCLLLIHSSKETMSYNSISLHLVSLLSLLFLSESIQNFW